MTAETDIKVAPKARTPWRGSLVSLAPAAGAAEETPPGSVTHRRPQRRQGTAQQRPGGLLGAKLGTPQPTFPVLHRVRLIRLLDDATQHHVTLLCAPAGSGKTTACALWAQSHQGAPGVGWLSLDRADNDPGRFRSYLLAALRRAEVSPQAAFSDVEASSHDDFPLLLAETAEQFTKPVVLILDDVHELTGSVVLDWLDKLIRYAPPRLVLVLSGRRSPPLQLARLRLSDDLADISAEALACTRDEADAYFGMLGAQADPGDLDELLRHTEGWMAGLRLAALRTQAQHAEHSIAGIAEEDPIVADYLRDEILAGHDERTRAFLLRTSITDKLTPDLADALTNTTDGAWFLDHLNRQNSLIGDFDGSQAWYRHPPLLRELLLAELRREMPEEIPVLLRRAARWYAQQEMPVEALRTAIQAPDLHLAAQVLADSDIPILMSRGPEEFEQMLTRVPADAAAADPAFGAAWAASRLWSGDQDGAHNYLAAAANAIGHAGRPVRPIVEAKLTALHVMAASSSAPDASPDMLTRASSDAEEMARGACAPAEHKALGLLWWAIGVAHLRRSELPSASYALRLAERELGAGAFPALQARAHAWRALCQAWQGKLTDAARVAAEALNADGPAAPATRDIARLALAIVNLMRDEPAAVHQLLDQIDEQDHAFLPGEPRVATAAMVIRTRTLIGRSDIATARTALSQLQEGSGRFTPTAADIRSLQGQLAIRSGDSGLRREIITELTEGASPATPGDQLVLSWLSIAENNPDRALTAAESCLAAQADGAKLDERISALLAAAVAHRRLKNTQRAIDLLEQALLLAEPEETYRPFLDGGPAARAVLTGLVEPASRTAGFTRRILQRFDAQPPVLPTASRGAIPALSDSELTVLRFLPSRLSNQEISEALFVSINTVKTHLRSIYRKLGAGSRREAVALARHTGLVT